MNRVAIKDTFREGRLFNSRVIVAAVCMAIGISLLIARMVYLQIIKHEHFTSLSQENQVSILPIPANRGLIYDRRGVLLAQNLPAFSLEVVPERVADMQQTLAALRELIPITDNDIARFHERMRQQRRFQPVPLRLQLNDEELARIAVNRYRLPGVEIQARLVRNYPLANLTAHAVGYVGRISEQDLARIDETAYAGSTHIGKNGVEKAYESVLHGKVGYQQVETNAYGRTVRVLDRIAPTPGNNLVLSLDTELHLVAKSAFGPEAGALVAIDPNTGEVLALVSNGDFDPNLFINGIDRKTYAELRDHPQRPLYNRALQGIYPPGSTVKPLVGLAGLELEAFKPSDAVFCRGFYTLPGSSHRYRDWKKEGHGTVNLHRAIVQSCDVYFYQAAQRIGIQPMADFLAHFGFGHKTGIDIPGESSGTLPSPQWKQRARRDRWYPGETLISGIGQGYWQVTPLQLATSMVTLANRGKPVKPHLLKKTVTPLGKETPAPIQLSYSPVPIKDPANWDAVIAGMTDVVHSAEGTAKRIADPTAPYKIAGKTGTAQVFSVKQGEKYEEDKVPKHLRDHALFVAFAPVEKPQIAVAVVVEHGGHGGSAAAPVAGAVIRKYLENWKP